MAQKKILILTNRIPYPLKDGGNLAMRSMIEGYHQAGWKVFLLSMNTSRHHVSREVLSTLYQHLEGFQWVNVNNDLKWTDIARNFFFARDPEHVKRFSSAEFSARLQEVLVSFQPDAVQVESVFLTSYLPVIKQYSHAVTVLRLHNIEYQIWHGMARRTANMLKKVYLRSLTVRVRNYERAAWKQYDLLLPITEKDSYLVQRLEETSDLVVAPFSVGKDKLVVPAAQERWVGYHLGAMDWLPNKAGMQWFLKKAWPLIHKSTPRFEFYFGGRHMPREFRELQLAGVHCEPDVESADEFIADKKILIVPIFSGGGIRVKILEAMGAGKVVITTSSGIKGIEAKPNDHYLRAQSPGEFARAVKWCLENKAEAERMAQRARDLVLEKYEDTQVMKRVTDKVEALINAATI